MMNEILFIASLDQGPWGLNFTMTFKFYVCFVCLCFVFLIFPKSPLLWYLISEYFETFFFVSSRSSPLFFRCRLFCFSVYLMLQLLLSILLSILLLLLLFQRYFFLFGSSLSLSGSFLYLFPHQYLCFNICGICAIWHRML